MGGGFLSLVLIHGKNTACTAGTSGCNVWSRGRVGVEEVDIRVEQKQTGKNRNNKQ